MISKGVKKPKQATLRAVLSPAALTLAQPLTTHDRKDDPAPFTVSTLRMVGSVRAENDLKSVSGWHRNYCHFAI
jgi:hypothetical protein